MEKTIEVFGKQYILTDNEIDNYQSLTPLFEEEEEDVLYLKETFGLEVREDLLILFIHMYLHRFAIPYFQIMENTFPNLENASFLREVLYYCMVGRAVDDIVDNDSKMFKKYESVLIADYYSKKLSDLIGKEKYKTFRQYLIESAKFESSIVGGKLKFPEIEYDVYIRIRYFFLLSEQYPIEKQDYLKKYVGILLGGLDLNDAIADGYRKESSTVISNNMYNKFINDEGKVLLDNTLVTYYNNIKSEISKPLESLKEEFRKNSFNYSFNILNELS